MDISKLNDMNRQFDERLSELMSLKGQNTQFFTNESYTEMIEKVKSAKSKKSHKKPEDYQRLRRFDIMAVGETEKLIVPVKDNMIRYYVKNNEIFQILHDTHLSVGHGGRNRMEKELNFRYKNITREMIAIYLNLCESCEKKRSVPKKGLVVKPILSGEMNARCQVDLIDMQSQGDNQYKFILVYQDHRTKFVQLRPLKTKTAKEIAYVLLDIFTIFGAPSILQSGNGREFANKIVREACKTWPELKIVHGRPRHSQSQGSVERANQDIENMLSTWLEDNNTKKWSEGLRFVQLMKNRAHHTGINCTPYEAMFGTKLKVGLKSSSIPHEALLDINSEEDLEKLLSTESTSTERNLVDFTENDQVESAKNDQLEPIDTDRVESTQNDMNLFSASSSQFSPTFTVDEKSEKTSDTDSNPIPNTHKRKRKPGTQKRKCYGN
ncbi:KRAB-A domain-containing protein 2-like [Anoplophora glabripennis]|uniref:KRAB-A domain-containing protein 2-like n=1 Tax=Anoplophora glabripennis TaxID=217634 RepID=UPI000C78B682|nr:KRAB-A domain-containing protein 2-like [Anoplophora glabripennis]